MTVLQAAILGLVQGLTEFLPVSSSGHLVLGRALMNLSEIPVLFDVVLHVATLFVVIWVFRLRVWAILKALGRGLVGRLAEGDRPSLLLAAKLAGASVITAAIGFGVSRYDSLENPRLVSALLLVTAAVLIVSAFPRGSRSLHEVGWGQALLMGTAQGFGVFPGISRAGSTIGTGMISGLDREAAGEFSFLLSIPAVGGAFLLTLKDAAELSESVGIGALTVGFLAALVAGYAALKILLWLVKSGRLWVFAFYLVPVGILGLILF